MNQRMYLAIGFGTVTAILLSNSVLLGCSKPDENREMSAEAEPTTGEPEAPAPAAETLAPDSSLADTEWRLVEFQSMDDAVGTVRPVNPSHYTMSLNGNGTVNMRLNCNQANGTWSAEASRDTASGSFEFGPLATTRALCPPPSLDESIAAQAEYIRSYLLKEDKLYLSLVADGGIYVWEPNTGEPSATGVPAAPEDGGPRNWDKKNLK